MAGRNTRISISVTASTGDAVAGLRAVQTQLGRLNDSTKKLSSAAQPVANLVTRFTALGAAGVGLLPLVSGMAAAGAGIGALAAAAGPQLASVSSAMETYNQAQELAATDTKASAEQMAAYKKQLAAMPAATADTTKAAVAAKNAFSDWSDEMAPDVMPLFTRALEGVKAAIPGLTPLVKAAADAVKPFVEQFAAAAEGGGVERFSKKLAPIISQTLPDLLATVRDVTVGVKNFFLAFAGGGTAGGATKQLADMAAQFRDFSESLGDSQGFADFKGMSEDLSATLLSLVGTVVTLSAGLLPLIQIASDVAAALLPIVAALPPEALAGIAIAVLALAQAFRILQAAEIVMKIAQMDLNLAFLSSPIFWVIAAVIALVAAIVLLWRNSETFRTVVIAVWNAVKTAIGAVWNFLVNSVFTPIGQFFTTTIPGWARSLATAVTSAWNGLRTGVAGVWNAIKSNVLNPIKTFFTSTIPGWARQLRTLVVAAFNLLKTGISTWWDGVKRIFNGVKTFFTETVPGWAGKLRDKVVDAFNSLRDKIDSIVGKIKDLWDSVSDIAGSVLDFVGLNATISPGLVTGGGGGGLTVNPLFATRMARATQAGNDALLGALASDREINLHVSIDGQQLQGRINRSVNRAMNADGMRLISKGWA